MDSALSLVCRLVIGGVLTVASLGKAADLRGFAKTLEGFRHFPTAAARRRGDNPPAV